ncbi:MAG: replication and repair protein RecF [Thermoleophilaceae bacterium]|jgi:DNA replication and repair protein RecF|nr:replication and repair protein RecF [Thermoleophilaceae bacterium]
MQVTRLELRDFRNYEAAELELPAGLTVVIGPNGAGKTNLLEAVYFGCAGASPRTSNERELVRRGASVARVVIETRDDEATHRLEAGFQPGEAKHLRVDGSPVASLAGLDARPLVSVFLPERLELVKGAPAARRAHLDQVVAALWPARAGGRAAYSRVLAQRNALLTRIRAGASSPSALDAWDAELAREGIALMENRAETVDGLREPFARLAEQLGLPGPAEVRYRPRSAATDAAGLAAELAERRAADLDRGFTAHGPHRDELSLQLDGAALRAYGSQGQQRAALLALLFAERELLAARRDRPPLMLLDDVMSELDSERRELLAELLRSGGQAIVTATEAGHVPGVSEDELVRVGAGAVLGPVTVS